MLVAGSAAFIVFGYPLFLLLNSGSLIGAITAHCGLAVIESIYVSVAVSAGVELFATRVRYSGFSVGYNVCVAGFGGTTPYIVTWLTAATANNLASAFYLIAAAVVSLATVLTLPETAAKPLVQTDDQPEAAAIQ
jgi:MHS family proline/betaine transporter-like MFS transporter